MQSALSNTTSNQLFKKLNIECKAIVGKILSNKLLKQEFEILFKGVKRQRSA